MPTVDEARQREAELREWLLFLLADGVVAGAERYPQLKLIVDHLGQFRAGGQGAAGFAHLPELLALARYPNMAILVAAVAENACRRDLTPTERATALRGMGDIQGWHGARGGGQRRPLHRHRPEPSITPS
jgi:hypothetical protein